MKKRKGNWKRICAAMLAAVLVFTMLPQTEIAALAADVSAADQLQEDVSSADLPVTDVSSADLPEETEEEQPEEQNPEEAVPGEEAEQESGEEEELLSETEELSVSENEAVMNENVSGEDQTQSVQLRVYDAFNNEIEKTGEVYKVDARKEFWIRAWNGDEHVKIGSIRLIDPVDPMVLKNTSVHVVSDMVGEVDYQRGRVLLQDDVAGRNVTVRLYGDEDKVFGEVTFQVNPVTTKVSVEKVVKGKLTQEAFTWKSYKISRDAAEALSEDQLGVICTAADGSSLNPGDYSGYLYGYNINRLESTLELVTGTAVGKDAVKVTIYNETAVQNGVSQMEAVVAEFDLTVSAPSWVNKAPKVKVVKSSDVSLYLQIDAPVDLGNRKDYFFYYVTATPKDAKEKATSFWIDPKQMYDVGEDLYELPLCEADYGEGHAAKFDITVQLLANSEQSAPESLDTDTILLKGKQVNLKGETKNPYYPDKITLKNKVSKVYSGQQNVAVATIDFGKKATYVSDDDVSVSVEYMENSRYYQIYPVDAEIRDGKVYVDVEHSYSGRPGKVKIRVSTYAENLQKVYADMTLNVVPGIPEFEVLNDGCSIYKQKGKAASIKLEIDYANSDVYSHPECKPANPSYTYKVGYLTQKGRFVEDADVLGKGMVSVKKGTVTVNKKYQVNTEDKDANRFAVQIRANDYAGNKNEYCAEFTVTQECAQPGILACPAFVKLVSGEPMYKVFLGTDIVIPAVYLVGGAETCLLDPESDFIKNYDPSKEYTYEEWHSAVQDIQYSLKADRKEIWAEAEMFTIRSVPDKKVTLTATTKDGGKKTSKMTFTVSYDKVSEKGKPAVFYTMVNQPQDASTEPEAYAQKPLSDSEINWITTKYDGKDPVVLLTVDDLTNKPFAPKPFSYGDYSISVSGAKVISDQDDLMESVYDLFVKNGMYTKAEAELLRITEDVRQKNMALYIRMVSETATVTLKDRKGNVLYTYQLQKEPESALEKAPTVSLKKGTKIYAGLKNLGYTDADGKTIDGTQPVTFTLSKAFDVDTTVRVVYQGNKAEMILGSVLYEGEDAVKEVELPAGEKEFTFVVNPSVMEVSGVTYFQFFDQDTGRAITGVSNAVKMKTEKLKKTYQITSSAKLMLKEKSWDTLAYKAEGVAQVVMVAYGPLNANVGGKPNHFRELFSVEQRDQNGTRVYGTPEFTVSLTNDLAYNPEKEEWLKDKKNLTGYIEVQITYLDGSKETRLQKITVNMVNKQVGTYKATATLGEDADNGDALVNIEVAQTGKGLPKEIICPGAVYVEMESVEILNRSEISFHENPDDKQIEMTISQDTKPGTYKGTLYFIPLDNVDIEFAKKTFGNAGSKEQYKDWLKKRGIAVPITFTIPEKTRL